MKASHSTVGTLSLHLNMQNLNLDRTIAAWSSITETVFVPRTEPDYQRLVALLDNLIDRVGEDESHPLASMMDVIGVLIENYEAKHVPELERDTDFSAESFRTSWQQAMTGETLPLSQLWQEIDAD